MSRVLSGRPVEEAIYAQLRRRISGFSRAPKLVVVRLGEDPASVSYVHLKDRRARALGLRSKVVVLPEDTEEIELLRLIDELNYDDDVDGLLVQLPLPVQIDQHKIIEAIDPKKDVDGFHPLNVGRLWAGEKSGMLPCTPEGIMRLLDHYQFELKGRDVVIVGHSNIVGKPLAALMLERCATVTVSHACTKDLKSTTRRAEVLVVAVGHAGLITPEMVRPGAVVVDVGVNRTEEGLRGDVAPAVAEKAGALTPVPGGVGPLTVAVLLENTVRAYESRYS